jgi:hypothetical protein
MYCRTVLAVASDVSGGTTATSPYPTITYNRFCEACHCAVFRHSDFNRFILDVLISTSLSNANLNVTDVSHELWQRLRISASHLLSSQVLSESPLRRLPRFNLHIGYGRLSLRRVWRWQPSGIMRRVVSYKFTDISSLWWWRWYAPLKRRSTAMRLYGEISQKVVIFILAPVRTWNLTICVSFVFALQ